MGPHQNKKYQNKSYQVTIWLTVTDPRMLEGAATELAKAIEMPDWNSRRDIRDHLLMLIEPGEIPGVRVLETVVNQTDCLPVSPSDDPADSSSLALHTRLYRT
jgi:hypothetical protein